MFFRLWLRLRLQNTAALLNPDSLTQPGTKAGGIVTGNSTPDKHGVIKDVSGNGLDAVIRPTEPVPL